MAWEIIQKRSQGRGSGQALSGVVMRVTSAGKSRPGSVNVRVGEDVMRRAGFRAGDYVRIKCDTAQSRIKLEATPSSEAFPVVAYESDGVVLSFGE